MSFYAVQRGCGAPAERSGARVPPRVGRFQQFLDETTEANKG